MKNRNNSLLAQILSALGAAALVLTATASAQPPALPKPDARPADLTKPVKVFLMLGQSNMVGMGRISGGKGETLEKVVKTDKLYPFLVDDAGNWTERKDVRYVQVMVGRRGGPTQLLHNEWLAVGGSPTGKPNNGGTVGIEFGVGHQLGQGLSEPVMLLKSCIGNRSLGWDLLPPGSKGYEFKGKEKSGADVTYTYAGYKESPLKWVKGTEPQKIEWYAGKQWDDDLANAKTVLSELGKHYPGATKYEVAGIFWWQGEKDAGDDGHAAHYEENLVAFIKAVRKEFAAPTAKFVLATLGEAGRDAVGNEGTILKAMMAAVDGKSGKYPDFQGNVATVYTHDMARGGSGNAHYGLDTRVYMDVGLAMGEAMLQLLKNQ